MHFKNLAADGADDFPTADTRPQGHGQGAEEFYQVRDFQAGDKTAGYQGQGDDPHRFLGVIGTVRKGHQGR